MEDNIRQFAEEGMKRYKDASSLIFKFEEIIENELRSIIKNRKNWGKIRFQRDKKVRSKPKERFKIFADFECVYLETSGKLRLGIIWDEISDKPYYYISSWGNELFDNVFVDYHHEFFNSNAHSIGFRAKNEDFDLERDFNLILDEFIRII